MTFSVRDRGDRPSSANHATGIVEPMDQRERKSSQTAIGVAVLRAVHQLYDGSPKILSDPIVAQPLDDGVFRQAEASDEWLS